MRILFLIVGLASGLGAAAMDLPAPPLDWAQTRGLQQAAATGDPVLPPEPGSTGDLLLAASELGAGVAAGRAQNFKPGDYDALYSLLQRYRDELAGLGLDVEAMEERLRAVESANQGLARRLEKLLPVDGAKIHGRLVSSFEDFHLLGPWALGIAASNPPTGVIHYQGKPRGDGVRHQAGFLRADLDFQVTRGLFSGLAEVGVVGIWSGPSEFGLRRVVGEFRAPLALQVGHLDVALSPLTLWRNEESAPYEPEPFKSRRDRLRRDYGLAEDRWRVGGLRLATDLRLFDSLTLQLESITAVPAMATGNGSVFPVTFLYRFAQAGPTFLNGDQLIVLHNTVLEAWRVGILAGPAKVAWLGAFFASIPESTVNSPFRGTSEVVQGGRLELKAGPFHADVEGMISGYQAPGLTSTAAPALLTGTAVRAVAGLQGALGSLRLKARAVSSGFHAAGAQGRTQDRNHQLMGPLLTEQGMIGSNGRTGIANGGGGNFVPTAPQNRWNNILIPPGVHIRRQSNILNPPPPPSAGTFGHLLPFSFIDSLAPYGEATPNRLGGGVEGELRLFNGAFTPSFGYDMAQQPENTNDPSLDPVNDGLVSPAQALTKGFSLQQARAGFSSRFELGLPMALGAGYTWLDLRNGQLSPLFNAQGQAVPFALTAGLMDAGAQVWLAEPLRLQLGWRQLSASGVAEKEVVSLGGAAVWYQWAVGLVLTPAEGLRFDLLWENMGHDNADAPLNAYSAENAYARITVEF